MAALFCTSVNLVTALTAAAPGPFKSVILTGGTMTVNIGTGPAGNNTITFAATAGNECVANFPSSVAANNGSYVGFGFNYGGAPSTILTVMSWVGQTGNLPLFLTTGGALQIGGTTGATLTTGVRHYVEVFVSVFNSATNVVIVNVDNQPYLTLTNVAGANVGYPVAPQLGINSGATTNGSYTLDSIYHIDNTGTQNNFFYGPRVVTYGIAAAPGQYSQYTPNGAATDWQCVDSIPPPGDVTYASDSTAGDQLAVGIGSILSLGSVNFVYIEATARQEISAGGRSIALGVGNGSVGPSYGPTQSLSTTYVTLGQVFDSNPNTGSTPWTVAQLATLQPAVTTVS